MEQHLRAALAFEKPIQDMSKPTRRDLLTDLTGGPWRLPRATGTGGASWQNETAAAATNEATFDAVTLTPSRVSSNSIVSKQPVAQSQPAIEESLIDELGQAIATEVDRVALVSWHGRRAAAAGDIGAAR